MAVLMEYTGEHKLMSYIYVWESNTKQLSLSQYSIFLVVLTLPNSSSYSETEMHQKLQDCKGLMTLHHLLHTNTKTFS